MKNRCDQCAREFTSKEALEMHTLQKHVTKGEAEQYRKRKQQQRKIKAGIIYALLILAVASFVYWIVSLSGGGSYSQGQVHWHADLSITICGENVPLPRPHEGQLAHGQSFIGTPLMHLHSEPTIHVEGTIRKAEEITLGRFMEVIGLSFTETRLLDKVNGDTCPDGSRGAVRLLVNGIENPQLQNKIIADGERYELRFE